MNLTAAWVRDALAPEAKAAQGKSDVSFTGVTTDSRKISPGILFVAIPGEKFDGHDFIAEALVKGAAGILCRKSFQIPTGSENTAVFFQVEDTVAAFRKMAAAWRSGFQKPVLAVAGSVGKTTTKELLSAVLRGKHAQVLKTEGSQNGFLGVAMTLMELRPSHGAAVIEIGIDEPGAMIQHLEVVRPTGAVLTAIGPEHLEKLKDLETVAREEAIALEWTAAHGGQVAINLDDPWIAPLYDKLGSAEERRLSFALGAEGRSDLPEDTLTGTLDAKGQLILSGPEIPSGSRVTPPLPGTHNARNLLAALAAAFQSGVTPEEAQKGLATFKTAGGRTEILSTASGLQILADHYNANPTSVTAALKLLTELKARNRGGRAWACLADMRELGEDEEAFHRSLADPIRAASVAGVFLYGPLMRHLQEELRQGSYTGLVEHFDSHAALATRLRAVSTPGDWVLIKGSRSMKMEKVLEAIK